MNTDIDWTFGYCCSENSYHIVCTAWCICFAPTTTGYDVDLANEAVRAGIVFG